MTVDALRAANAFRGELMSMLPHGPGPYRERTIPGPDVPGDVEDTWFEENVRIESAELIEDPELKLRIILRFRPIEPTLVRFTLNVLDYFGAEDPMNEQTPHESASLAWVLIMEALDSSSGRERLTSYEGMATTDRIPL
jgi:hypothetical protein